MFWYVGGLVLVVLLFVLCGCVSYLRWFWICWWLIVCGRFVGCDRLWVTLFIVALWLWLLCWCYLLGVVFGLLLFVGLGCIGPNCLCWV